MSIRLLESREDFDNLLKEAGDKAIIIDCYADWCGPCKQIAPAYAKMAETYANVIVCKINVDDADDLAAFLGVNAMPTFFLYKNGEKIDELLGANKEKLEEMFKKNN